MSEYELHLDIDMDVDINLANLEEFRELVQTTARRVKRKNPVPIPEVSPSQLKSKAAMTKIRNKLYREIELQMSKELSDISAEITRRINAVDNETKKLQFRRAKIGAVLRRYNVPQDEISKLGIALQSGETWKGEHE